MKFWEAIKALGEGKKVRCRDWESNAYWDFKSGELWVTIVDLFNLSCKEWELYQEPVQQLTFEEKLAVAKQAYKEIIALINSLEEKYGKDFCAHWDECISIDDELFHAHQMREEPVQTLTFTDVVKGLKEGKKYKRKAWVEGYIRLFGVSTKLIEAIPIDAILDPKGNTYALCIADIEATDWIEVK